MSVTSLMEQNSKLIEALRPLANVANEFQWVLDKGLDPEGVFIWSQSSRHNETSLSISIGDAFRARSAIIEAEIFST